MEYWPDGGQQNWRPRSTSTADRWAVESAAHDGHVYGQCAHDDAIRSNGLQTHGPDDAHDGHDGPLRRKPTHERERHDTLFVCLFGSVYFTFYLFIWFLADDGFGYQAGNDGWTFFWRRWSFRHGSHDSAWHAHGF